MHILYICWAALKVLEFGGCITDAASLSVQIYDQTVTSLYRESLPEVHRENPDLSRFSC